MASLTCAVVKGDLPLEIVWMFNGTAISKDRDDITISKSGKRSKQLSIDSVSARHAGEYTCVVSNVAGATQRTAVLDVNGTSPSNKKKTIAWVFSR